MSWGLGISEPTVCQTYVLQPAASHENDRNHENDEGDSDNHRQGVECWISGNHRNYGNDTTHGCNGQIVGQPRKRKCRQNVRKMSTKCPKNVKKCPEGLKTQFSDIFWTIFAYLVDALV